jgi:hypothetical protein
MCSAVGTILLLGVLREFSVFPIFNRGLQMLAAYIIFAGMFIASFLALFAFSCLCVAVVWMLYRCANRLAVLLPQLREPSGVRGPKKPTAFIARPSHALAVSSATRLNPLAEEEGWSDFN